MNEDEMPTAQSTALSPALRAQGEDQVFKLITLLDNIDTTLQLHGHVGTDLHERIRETLAEYLNGPRGQSASEAPCAAAVTPNPPEVS